MRENYEKLYRELQGSTERLKFQNQESLKRVENHYEELISKLEEERDNLQEKVNSYSLIQILSQSGILRSVKIEEGLLSSLLQKILDTEISKVHTLKDAPQPSSVPKKRTTRSVPRR
jgi:hypothetical protein